MMQRQSNGRIYLPDTSALIAAWQERYPRNMFSAVWQFIDGLNGRLMVCQEVRTEIARHAEDLLGWLDGATVDSGLSLNSIDENAAEAVQRHFQGIARRWPHWGAVRAGDHADP